MSFLKRLLQQLRPGNYPPAAASRGILAAQREIILQFVLNILLGIYTIFYALVLAFWPEFIRPQLQIVYILAYIGLFLITARRQTRYGLRAGIVITFLHLTGTIAIVSNGLVNFGWLFMFAGIVLSFLLAGHRWGWTHLGIVLITVALIAGLVLSGVLPAPAQRDYISALNPGAWAISGFVFLFAAAIAAISIYVIVQGLDRALQSQEQLTQALKKEQDLLEKRVEERSQALKNRLAEFEVASQIARQISGEMNLDNLLTTAAHLIRERFGFYHVGIFLSDEKNEFAVLKAATGEAGRQMLERGHRLKIGEIGLVGYTVKRGEARIASDVLGDALHFKNPLLPNTRSEMALPLRIGDKTIGALDVQSADENAFTPEGVNILQTIADQLAIAFQKVQLVDELSRTVTELEANYQRSIHQAWSTYLGGKNKQLIYHLHGDSRDLPAEASACAQEALAQGKSVLQAGTSAHTNADQQGAVLAVPIKLRNQVLGVVDVQFGRSSVSPDMVALIEATVNRLAISLDNARLFETTVRQAEREKKVVDITARIRATNDPEEMMQIAINELQTALRATRTQIYIHQPGQAEHGNRQTFADLPGTPTNGKGAA